MGLKNEDELDQALAEMEAAALSQTPPNEDSKAGTETSSEDFSGDNKSANALSSGTDDKMPSNPVRFKQIGGHFHSDVHKAINMIGVNYDRTIQSLVGEALADLMQKYEVDPATIELTKLIRTVR